jgi:hypothetical protein
LRSPFGHAGKSDQLAFFFAADPMRHRQFLKAYFQSQLSHFFGNVLDGPFGLG